MIDSVIFDLDGTLWDSSDQLYAYWSYSFPELSPDKVKEAMGKTLPEMAEFWGISVDKIRQIQKGENLYLRRYPGTPYPNLKRTIKRLKRQGYRLFIASNCQAGYIETFLWTTDLGKYFDDFICYDDLGRTKDLNVQNLIQDHFLSPVLVGDTKNDESAAQSNDIPFIWAKYGFGSKDPPCIVCKSIKELAELPDILRKDYVQNRNTV